MGRPLAGSSVNGGSHVEVLYERCCGLDVHKKTVTACMVVPDRRVTRTFRTMTKDLLHLADWLVEEGVTHVAMESTGVYWKPVYNLLEGLALQVLVVNAQHIKAVPGRKTDVKDAEWIAQLLQHGLIRGSFIPDRPQRELRELVRYRRTLIQQRAQVVSRIQKVLEGANIKLSSVASDVVGVSGRAMLEALISGTEDPAVLADLAKGRLRQKHAALMEALQGLMGAHQRLLLQSQLRHLDFLRDEIARLDEEVATQMHPFEEVLIQLRHVPGIGVRSGEDLIAEIGVDMGRFPTAGHFASWARLCPANHESAGKRGTGRIGHGNRWLRSTMVEIAWAAVRSKDTYFSAQYHRLASRRGGKRAVLAVAHTILVTVYHLLSQGSRYEDLGAAYFERRNQEAIVRGAVRRIERLGYKVTLDAA